MCSIKRFKVTQLIRKLKSKENFFNFIREGVLKLSVSQKVFLALPVPVYAVGTDGRTPWSDNIIRRFKGNGLVTRSRHTKIPIKPPLGAVPCVRLNGYMAFGYLGHFNIRSWLVL